MSEDTEDDAPAVLTAEQDLASTGAAADSAEADEKFKALPRLLRYAILSTKDESFAHERLIAEITALVPGEPLTLVWAQGLPSDGIVLAVQLDHLAVTRDQPDLRSMSDCVRLLSLTTDDLTTGMDDHLRVGKALIHAYRQLPANLDLDLAADIETFVAGWAALPSAVTGLSHYVGIGAAQNARMVGRRLATLRVDSAEEKLSEKYRKNEQERREAAALRDAGATREPTSANIVAEDHLVVCKLDEAAMKNQKTREVTAPFKGIINTALPLVQVPLLHGVRAQLLFEFPYAEQVIDFALADLVGRRTLRLRPLLLVGDAGGGKSRFARRLGESLGLGVWRTDASRSDGAVFGGTDKRWYSTEPCHPFLAITQAKHANPLVLIDEIEKAATRTDYGRFWDCLLAFLEPETAARYPDPALQTNLDLSQVSYVATANSLDPLPSPLRDRFRVVTFPKPAAADLIALLPAVIADLALERGLDSRWVEPLTGIERDTVAAHWRGGSVRRLRRVVEALLSVRERMASRN
jgi:ATP-dependent Lon protease